MFLNTYGSDINEYSATFNFEQLPDALRLFRTGKTIGKVVVTID